MTAASAPMQRHGHRRVRERCSSSSGAQATVGVVRTAVADLDPEASATMRRATSSPPAGAPGPQRLAYSSRLVGVAVLGLAFLPVAPVDAGLCEVGGHGHADRGEEPMNADRVMDSVPA